MIETHDKGFTLSANGTKPAPLDLPIEEIPTVRPSAGAVWTDGGDSRQTLQAAIDSGAEWICLRPVQTIQLDDTLILRGKVRLIMGLHGAIKGTPGKAAIRVEEGETPVVALEHICLGGLIEHPSSRTFVMRHGDIGGLAVSKDEAGSGLRATGTGKTHIIDVIGRGYEIRPRHSLWARQLNAEFGSQPLFINSGTSWILGCKMECSTRGGKDGTNDTPSILNKSRQLELFGGLLYTLGNKKDHAPLVPALTNEKGRIAISYRTNGIPATYYRNVLRMDNFQTGPDLTSDKIKGPGAALLTDQR